MNTQLNMKRRTFLGATTASGLTIGFAVMGLLFWLIRNWRPSTVNSFFGKMQILSAGYMGFGHGLADAQKTMGIIMLTARVLRGERAAGYQNGADVYLTKPASPEELTTVLRNLCRRCLDVERASP